MKRAYRLPTEEILDAVDALRREHPLGSPEHDEGLRRLNRWLLQYVQMRPPRRPSKRDADHFQRLLDMLVLHRSAEGKALLARSHKSGDKGYRELAKAVLGKSDLAEGVVSLAREYGRLIKTRGSVRLTPRPPARKKLSKA